MATGTDKFIYFLVGSFVGASVALLFAPKSGEETRRFLEDKYREGTEQLTQKAQAGKEYVTEKSREVSGKISNTLDRSREVVQRQKEQITAAIEAGKEAYQEEKQKLEGVSGE